MTPLSDLATEHYLTGYREFQRWLDDKSGTTALHEIAMRAGVAKDLHEIARDSND